jgi:type IV fimbrial biogenesis protein FimT
MPPMPPVTPIPPMPPARRRCAASRQASAMPASRSRGLSLVETLCACSIVATALGVSVAGMHDFIAVQRLKAAAAEVETEVQLARSSALVRSQPVRLAIQPLAGGSCLLVHTGPRDACVCGAEGLPACKADAEVLHLNRHDASSGVRFATNDVSIAFSAANAMVTPTATVRLVDRNGRALHQIVNVMGRTRTCTPSAGLPGFRRC